MANYLRPMPSTSTRDPVAIDLTPDDCRYGSFGGFMRRSQAERRGLRPAHGHKGDPLATDIDGALAEVAVAKWLNVFWDMAVGKLGGDDVF